MDTLKQIKVYYLDFNSFLTGNGLFFVQDFTNDPHGDIPFLKEKRDIYVDQIRKSYPDLSFDAIKEDVEKNFYIEITDENGSSKFTLEYEV